MTHYYYIAYEGIDYNKIKHTECIISKQRNQINDGDALNIIYEETSYGAVIIKQIIKLSQTQYTRFMKTLNERNKHHV